MHAIIHHPIQPVARSHCYPLTNASGGYQLKNHAVFGFYFCFNDETKKSCRKKQHVFHVFSFKKLLLSACFNLLFKCPHWVNPSLVNALSTFLPFPCALPCTRRRGENSGRVGAFPGRTGALSPEGRGHRLTDSLATSDQAESEGEARKGGRERERDRA